MNEEYQETGRFETEVLDEESAISEFERMLKAARVKWHLYELSHGKRDVDADKAILIDALQYGRIELNDEGFPTINTMHPKVERLVLRGRQTGVNWLVMDRVPEGHDIKKMHSLYAKAFGVSPAEFSALEDIDRGVAQRVYEIFLGY